MGKVISSSYQVASRYMIATLIRGGYLPFEKRHDADAVRAALAKLKAAGTSVKLNGGGKDPPSAA
jgi:hypothetical protein